MELTIGVICIYALLYILFCLCVIYPPTELISFGLTLQSVFRSFLGQEQVHFILYHARRTSLNVFAHSLLPLIFLVWLESIDEDGLLNGKIFPVPVWSAVFCLSVCFPLATGALVAYWAQNGWNDHPLIRKLKLYDPQWHRISAIIDTEYRRFDKFSVLLGGIRRVLVTDSWVIVTGTYAVYVSHQADVRLTVVRTDQHAISHHSDSQVQFLTIQVENLSKPIPPFSLRLNALDYRDLQMKLQSTVQTARDIIIHASLSERFVLAFIEHTKQNARYTLSDQGRAALDPCIGCMQETANVKLEKYCADTLPRPIDEEGRPIPDCVRCYCRPMWCVSCMGRWFASQQDQRRPDNWLAGKSPCPTCRATFCVLDVCLVAGLDLNL